MSEMTMASDKYNSAMESLAAVETADLDELRSYPTPPGMGVIDNAALA